MNRISIHNPKGIIPSRDAHLLPNSFAQKAFNCDFTKGTLKPLADLNTDTTFTAPGALRTLYKYESNWVHWLSALITVIRLQLAASDDRVMYTDGSTYPKQFDSNLIAATGTPGVDQATITGIAKGVTATVTAAAHGFSNADTISIDGTYSGMYQVNHHTFTVANKTDDTFVLSGIDTSLYGTFTGTATATKSFDYRRVGIPAPGNALTVAAVGAGADDKKKYTVAWVYTYVVKWADGTEEESPPSPVSAIADMEGNQYAELNAVHAEKPPPTLGVNGNSITHVRIYRLDSATSGASYRRIKSRSTSFSEATAFWYDIPIADWWPQGDSHGVSIYDSDGTGLDIWDNAKDYEIDTTKWANPPTDLTNIIQYQNGIIAGTSGKNVCLCEPFVFYAWPTAYRLPVDYTPVALGVYNRSLVVGTEAYPYIIYGTNASTMGKDRLPWLQRCMSKRGMISTEDGVFYVCPDGIFRINYSKGWGGVLATKGIIAKAEWEALPPTGKTLADITAYYYDGMFFGFFDGSREGFVFNFGEDPFFIKILLNKTFYHGLIDEEDDDLVLLTNTGGANYYADELDRSASDMAYKWLSKDFQTRYKNYAACRIRGAQTAASPIVMIPFGGGSQLQRKHVASSELPTSVVAEWKFDGDATDEQGTYDATLTGCKWGAGPKGFALELNGTSDYADAGDPFESTFQASFGIELCFNLDDGIPANNNYLFGVANALNQDLVAAYVSTGGWLYFLYKSNNNQVLVSSGSNVMADGLTGFQHLVCTVDTVAALAYVCLNGALLNVAVSIAGVTMGDYASTANLVWGGRNIAGSVDLFAAGRESNAKLYSQAISAAQALALYNDFWFKEVSNETAFPLPGVAQFKKHEFEFLGKAEMESAVIATSMEELDG